MAAADVSVMEDAHAAVLSLASSSARIVATVKRNASFSGTFSVPDFDDTKGLFHVSYFVNKFDVAVDAALPDSHTPLDPFTDHLVFEMTSLPSLNWNNTTKVMTVSPVVWRETRSSISRAKPAAPLAPEHQRQQPALHRARAQAAGSITYAK